MPILAISRQPVLHPGELADSTLFLNTPFDFFERANSYTCPLGPKPGSAWILMLRVVQDRLDVNAFHELRWADGKNLLTIPSLSIVKSSTMNMARRGDGDAARLVEFRDKRHQLGMFSSIDAQYNVRIPAPSTTSGTGLYYTDSLNSGSTWTWQTLVTNVWAALPSTAGTAPTLPYSPDDKPEGFRFIGVNAWEALHVVLEKINCTTAYDPIADTFSYVRLGTTQAGLAAKLAGLTRRLMYDYDPGSDFQLGNMPATVRVFFHRREEAHGWERDTPNASNWEMFPAVSKDRATSIAGALSGSVLAVWDDLPALFNSAGANSNSAALQTRANEIGDNIRDRIDVSEERGRRMYSGLVEDILPGSEVSEVRWRDFGDETGLVTEIVRIPLREGSAFFELKRNVATAGGFVGEKLQTTDLARATHPLWPRLGQIVQVNDGASADGAELTATGGFFPGFVHRWANGAYGNLEACWIRPVDLDPDDAEATVIKLRQLDRFVGRLSGIETVSSDTRPVYLVRSGAKAADIHDVSADTGTTVTIDAGDTVDFDTTDGDFDTEANSQSLRGLVVKVSNPGGGTTKRLEHAIDKSPVQNIVLSGSKASGGPVLGRDVTRNSIELEASVNSITNLVGTSGKITFTVSDPLAFIRDDAGPTTVNLDYRDTLEFIADKDDFTVTKLGSVVTVNLASSAAGLPIGAFIPSYLAPILDNGKFFLDRNGVADLDWALADGLSNVGGSGIKLATQSGTEESFFIRPRPGTTGNAADTAFGRSVNAGAVDDDEVRIQVSVADHVDHIHTVATDTCHGDVVGATHFDFSTAAAQNTSIQLASPGGGALTLSHTVTLTLTNNQGTTSPAGEHVEMTPPYKELYWFERVA